LCQQVKSRIASKCKTEIRYAQLNNWVANFSSMSAMKWMLTTQIYQRNSGDMMSLIRFQRVNVAAGKVKHDTINPDYPAFEFFDKADYRMAVTPGKYELLHATSSEDKDLKTTEL
jgi:hypothetical protein